MVDRDHGRAVRPDDAVVASCGGKIHIDRKAAGFAQNLSAQERQRLHAFAGGRGNRERREQKRGDESHLSAFLLKSPFRIRYGFSWNPAEPT
jgi:hypothetical protein